MTNNIMLKLIFKYCLKHKAISFFGIYFLGSTILKSITTIDICIPCIWHAIFGIHCPACGITNAFTHLLRLDILSAYNSNWMIFLVLPIGIWYVGRDFYNYYKKEVT